MRLRSLVLSGRSLSSPLVSTFKPHGSEFTPLSSNEVGSRKLEFRFKARIKFIDGKN